MLQNAVWLTLDNRGQKAVGARCRERGQVDDKRRSAGILERRVRWYHDGGLESHIRLMIQYLQYQKDKCRRNRKVSSDGETGQRVMGEGPG